MTPQTASVPPVLDRHRRAGLLAAALVVGALGLAGCSAISAVQKAIHTVEGNKATIDAFTRKIQSTPASPFEATYVTTGASPATVVYAVSPPKGLAFTDTPTGSGAVSVDIVVNSTGEYSCQPPSAGGSWTCQKLDPVSASTENQIFDFYTPSHWIGFLQDFSLAAGFAGDKVSQSTMSVNGFPMSCVDFVASGVAGTSTICTTAQGILGYVNVASDSTSFEIKNYTTSPSASLFQTPPGATITQITTPTTS